ncbi:MULTISPECIES: hypothetical protein [unclassified Curtobacterium]|uniref:hypothetical protein n=1 Tax=unclassified Curtobacterium TaxID=257496 RepID=UPI000DA7A41E|nr:MULTISPECIES: hypothetical protein [unclassified Curtobacterium]PZE29910.1 hypothetical protein DEI86_01080 [Curtobacterium sp. MCBD17_028]PZF60953.1 hypothetical protein DEI92_04830 [Curtobacterium sp. MCBD17_034]PZF66309.1 hypothetical protein DEI81_01445 [Curtobacterium sp. MCBD17_013]PZM40303.1 hypothetical protein DEI90_01065 [Curtobacterium sp. MCBD17_031]WIB64872.1 hypothetical protein DEI94_06725 [Curtobacterium sp. MCBD17_040]
MNTTETDGRTRREARVDSEGVGRRIRTFGWFFATVVVSGASSIVTIPVIVTLTSAHSWAAVALGQAVGSSLSVLTMFGWGITGPARIAMMPRSEHAVAYWDSIVARLIVLVPVLAITVGVTWVIAPTAHLAAVVAGVAMAAGGLSGTWALIGRREPVALFWADTVPRVVGTVLGVGALALGGGLIAFSALQLAGALAAFVIVSVRLLGGVRRPAGGVHDAAGAWRVIREQRHGVAVAVAVAAYYPLVLVIVARFIPAQLPLYALNEKLLRFATMAMQPVHQYMQAAVPSQQGRALVRALRRSLAAILVISVLAWVVYTVLLPVASGLLTAGQVQVPAFAGLMLGAFMGFSVLGSYMTSVALVAVDRVGVISRGSLIGFGAGLLAVLLTALIGAADALAAGFVVTGIVTVLYQTTVFVRAMPRHADVQSDIVLLDAPEPTEPAAPGLPPAGSGAVAPIVVPEV